MPAHLMLGQLFKGLKVDFFDQPAMQAHLGVKQFIGLQEIWRGRRSRFRYNRRRFDFWNLYSAVGSRLRRNRRRLRNDGSMSAKSSKHSDSSLCNLYPGFHISLSAARHRAHDHVNFLTFPPKSEAEFLAAALGITRALSSAVILFPGIISSSGTPRSIASRTRP